MDSEFKEFYMDDELNKQLLKDTLKGSVRLTPAGDVILEAGLKPIKKALVLYLLANKILKLDGLKVSDAEGPKEISEKTGFSIGTVKPIIRELFDEGIVKQTEEGKYYVPNYALLKVQEIFKHKEG